MSARSEILTRIRKALADVPALPPEEDVPQDWVYGRPTAMPDILERFVEMCVDYKADVVRAGQGDVGTTVARMLVASGAASIVLPRGVPGDWRQAIEAQHLAIHEDDPPLTHVQLDRIDAVLTASAVGIAETGTIVLDHADDQGRRELTLVPDLHLVVVRTDQVVSDVPEAVQRLSPAIEQGRPLTWISGPSATSDIELSRVEGVHGPRRLLVVLSE